MYDNRFTPRAQNALRLAQAAAEELGHSYVGSEHLLLGLLREEAGAAHRCLAEQSVTAERARAAVVQIVGTGLAGLAPPQGLTPRAKRVIENAVGESGRTGGGYVGTEHLLLGILRENGTMAMRVLDDLGTDPRKLQTALLQRMSVVQRLPREAPTRIAAPRREELPRSKALEQFTRSLNALAREGKLDPVDQAQPGAGGGARRGQDCRGGGAGPADRQRRRARGADGEEHPIHRSLRHAGGHQVPGGI